MAVKNDEMTFNDLDLLASKHDERGYDLDDEQDDELDDGLDDGKSLIIDDLKKNLENIGKYQSLTTLDENNENKVYTLIADEKVTGFCRSRRSRFPRLRQLKFEQFR